MWCTDGVQVTLIAIALVCLPLLHMCAAYDTIPLTQQAFVEACQVCRERSGLFFRGDRFLAIFLLVVVGGVDQRWSSRSTALSFFLCACRIAELGMHLLGCHIAVPDFVSYVLR